MIVSDLNKFTSSCCVHGDVLVEGEVGAVVLVDIGIGSRNCEG